MTGIWSLRTGRVRGGVAPNVIEVVLAVLLSAVPVAVAAGVIHLSGTRPGVAACLGVVALTLPVAWSRPQPLTAAAVLAVAAVANGLLFGHAGRCGVVLPAVYFVGFGIGARLGWPRAAAGLALCTADVVAEGYYDPQIGWPGLLTVLPLLLVFFGLGRLLRARSRTTEELRAKSALLRRQREETARLAIATDRAEMSTAIDESLRGRLGVIADTADSVLRPEADTAADTEASDPEAVRRALAAIERDGRAALGELREVVGTLRQPAPAPSAPVGPQPTLARLPELLRGLRGSRARCPPALNCPGTGSSSTWSGPWRTGQAPGSRSGCATPRKPLSCTSGAQRRPSPTCGRSSRRRGSGRPCTAGRWTAGWKAAASRRRPCCRW